MIGMHSSIEQSTALSTASLAVTQQADTAARPDPILLGQSDVTIRLHVTMAEVHGSNTYTQAGVLTCPSRDLFTILADLRSYVHRRR